MSYSINQSFMTSHSFRELFDYRFSDFCVHSLIISIINYATVTPPTYMNPLFMDVGTPGGSRGLSLRNLWTTENWVCAPPTSLNQEQTGNCWEREFWVCKGGVRWLQEEGAAKLWRMDRLGHKGGALGSFRAGQWGDSDLHFFLFMAAPEACGSSQARDGIGAAAARLHHIHSNMDP